MRLHMRTSCIDYEGPRLTQYGKVVGLDTPQTTSISCCTG